MQAHDVRVGPAADAGERNLGIYADSVAASGVYAHAHGMRTDRIMGKD
jgi:hypothetical protein